MQNSSPFSSIQNEGNSFAESKKFGLENQLALYVSAVLSMSIFSLRLEAFAESSEASSLSTS